MTTYTLTVNIAPSLTSASTPGHMWYSIGDSNGNKTSFGFEPATHNAPFGQGIVESGDNNYFQGTNIFSESIQITQAEYNTLQSFGQSAIEAQQSGRQIITGPNNVSFSLWYNGVTNSCIDFTWASLATIGIDEPSTFTNPRLIPSENEDLVNEAIADFVVYGPNGTPGWAL